MAQNSWCRTRWVLGIAPAMLLLGVALVILAPGAAGQEPSPVVVDSSATQLSLENDDGERTATVQVLNMTTDELELSAKHAVCALTVSPSLIEEANLSAIVVTTSDCEVGAEFSFSITASIPGSDAVLATVEVEPTIASKPRGTDWDPLVAIPIGLVVGVVACLVAFFCFDGRGKEGEPSRTLTSALPGLAADWSFKDSWVSTVTVISTAAIGLLGAGDVLNKIVGENPEETTAVLTVGAGISTALVLSAPIILSVFQTEDREHTVHGVLLGAILVLGGALGMLGLIAVEMGNVFGAALWPIRGAIIVAAVILCVYGVKALIDILDDGIKKKETRRSDTLVAATLIVAAIDGRLSERNTDGSMSGTATEITVALDDLPMRHTRAAMI